MIAPAPVVNDDVPVTVNAPVCVIELAPVAITVKFPVPPVPTVDVPRVIALISVTATLLAPLLFKLTAPIKLFDVSVSVMPNAPVVKLAAVALDPCTIPPAACVIAPPAVITIFPTVVKAGTS